MTIIAETERLILRRLTPEDEEALHTIVSDPVTMAFWPRPFTREEAAAWIRRSRDQYAERGFGRYAVVDRGSGALIGDCGILATTTDGEPVNDIGYILHHPYWGRGLATEAAAAVRDYAFGELGLPVLHANMPHDHHGSRRVAEKIGMRFVREFANARNRGIRTLFYVLENPAAAQ
jgi:Acetyltransferases, including N-acetylases of ribosomal proteins